MWDFTTAVCLVFRTRSTRSMSADGTAVAQLGIDKHMAELAAGVIWSNKILVTYPCVFFPSTLLEPQSRFGDKPF